MSHIWIVTHERPDGDALGAACGWWYALRESGATATVVACGSYPAWWPLPIPTPSILTTPPIDQIDPDRDRIMLVDAPSLFRCGRWTETITRAPHVVIDHHATPGPRDVREGETLLAIIDPKVVSTCDLCVQNRDRVLAVLGLPPSPMTDEERLWWYLGTWTDTLGLTVLSDPTIFARLGSLFLPSRTPSMIAHLRRRLPWDAITLWQHMQIEIVSSWVLVGVTATTYCRYGLTANTVKDVVLHWWGATATYPGIVLAVEAESEPSVYVSVRSWHHPPRARQIAERLGGGGHDGAAGVRLSGRLDNHVMAQLRTVITDAWLPPEHGSGEGTR